MIFLVVAPRGLIHSMSVLVQVMSEQATKIAWNNGDLSLLTLTYVSSSLNVSRKCYNRLAYAE